MASSGVLDMALLGEIQEISTRLEQQCNDGAIAGLLSADLLDEQVRRELEQTDAAIAGILSSEPDFLSPEPGGSSPPPQRSLSRQRSRQRSRPRQRSRSRSRERSSGAGVGSECKVCQEDIEITTKRYLLGCGHVFHHACLAPWLRSHNTCPTCREQVRSKRTIAAGR